MNKLSEYFHTDWGAMTQHDWIGLIMTILVFLIMIGLYIYVFHPANKERLEAQRRIPLDDDYFPENLSQRHSQRPSPKNGAEDKQ